MSIVRENLLTRKGYTPYCGNLIARDDIGGCDNPRTSFDGEQFKCPKCSYRTNFEPEFIERYKTFRNRPLWADEMEKLGNREALADRLEFHGTLFVRDVVRYTGLSSQTIIKHFDALVADGRAVRGRPSLINISYRFAADVELSEQES